jgi:hypothetical protein
MMIDAQTFKERTSSLRHINLIETSKCICPVCTHDVPETPADYDHELRQLSSAELLLCASTVCGFSLASHEWLKVSISDLGPIQWTENAINKLVLDEKQKKVILSLVTSPIFTEGVSADIIGWKGRGLVALLHGAPGTGKTLTAECVCEHLHRPLYIVNGGELGTEAKPLEESLGAILELSKRWKAVILIDEADIFLEQRSPSDIERNSLVSGR